MRKYYPYKKKKKKLPLLFALLLLAAAGLSLYRAADRFIQIFFEKEGTEVVWQNSEEPPPSGTELPAASSSDTDISPEAPSVSETASDSPEKEEEKKDEEDYSYLDEQFAAVDYYYYNLLGESEQEIYKKLYAGFESHQEEISFTFADKDFVLDAVSMILADHPEIFWLDGSFSYSTGLSRITILPNYAYSADECQSLQQRLDEETAIILSLIQTTETEYEKTKAVFEYIVNSVDYVSDSPDNQNIISALLNKQSVCAGYSKATQLLLQKLGISSIYVSGKTADAGLHAWLLVRINGNYYHLDSTYGDRTFLNEDGITNYPPQLACRYDYLCCSDWLMARDRSADVIHEDYPLPSCPSDDLNYYLLNGCRFDSYSDEVYESMNNSLLNGETTWLAQFTDAEAYLQLKADLENGLYANSVRQVLNPPCTIYGWYTFDDTAYSVACWYEEVYE